MWLLNHRFCIQYRLARYATTMEIQHPDRMRLKSCHLVGVTVETLLLIAVAVFGVFICVFRNPFKEEDLPLLCDVEDSGKSQAARFSRLEDIYLLGSGQVFGNFTMDRGKLFGQ